MAPENLLDGLRPEVRVLVAVLPFVVAMMLRLLIGKTRTASWLITLGTVWFAVNVLMAPYSDGMRQSVRNMRRYVP